MFKLLVTVIISLFIATLAEVITVPLVGALVRFRANYAPKGIQLDSEGGVQPYAGPIVPSYFAMIHRVWRLEGWKGFYKGFVPSVFFSLVVTLFIWIYIGASMPRGTSQYSAPSATPLQLLGYSVFLMCIGLPVTILFNRAVTTPYLLPWTMPTYALSRLFTPTELRKPWLLYLTPGLLGAKLLHLGYVVLILRTLRSLLLPSIDTMSSWSRELSSGIPPDFTPLRIGTYITLAGLSTVVLCPLEVIATRLSLQRNHPSSATFEAVPRDQGSDIDAEYVGTEDVIGLRNEFDPYVGFTDAAKRMVEEEGWIAMYRGWWVTLLAGILSTFA